MWTDEKINILIEKYSNTDNDELSRLLGIKKSYIITKANKLFLYKTKEFITGIRKKNNPKTYWSDDELKNLKLKYKDTSNRDLAELLKKTKKSVGKKLKELNLYRTKDEKDYITSKTCKKNGRDLTFNFVEQVAKMYNTRHEFYLFDSPAYSVACKNKWLDIICKHMVVCNISIPQLILKDILEFIFKINCSFNDRKTIFPLEIDCYFPKWRIGWEYDGKYFHNDVDDEKKRLVCKSKNITLFNITEKTDNFKNYELNIKQQLIEQLFDIIKITNIKITSDEIINYTPIINYPNVLTNDEKEKCVNKKISEIKDINLIKKIKKYNLYQKYNIINDSIKYNRFVNYDEYIKYLKNKNYKSFTDLCKFEHPHRLMKKWGLPIQLIHELFK